MLYKDLNKIKDLEVCRNVPLSSFTTFRIGGPAHLMLFPRTLKALELTVSYLSDRSIDYKILGQGSNLLINDGGIDVVMSLSRLNHIYCSKEGDVHSLLEAEAGCRLRSLLSWSIHKGLGGLEGLSGIPASVGGAISMNAGTGRCSMADLIKAVLFTGPEGSQWIPREELHFGCHSLELSEKVIISAARIRLERHDPEEVRISARKVMQRRKVTQPMGRASAGCIFRNPPGDFAGRLIELCGLKGLRIGDAEVSKKHANFIINYGKARAIEVLDLLETIKERVKAETNIELAPELSIWGPGV
ncbi:MAG: UDP-N-acetylmuramate dehydrogenase [Nitrospiraceae bacterium]|nr:UDP-N-acetylmuramate dehydrogenase [Nitrospiraceae bacterium]